MAPACLTRCGNCRWYIPAPGGHEGECRQARSERSMRCYPAAGMHARSRSGDAFLWTTEGELCRSYAPRLETAWDPDTLRWTAWLQDDPTIGGQGLTKQDAHEAAETVYRDRVSPDPLRTLLRMALGHVQDPEGHGEHDRQSLAGQIRAALEEPSPVVQTA